ncbi:MAG: PEP-CTERM sorting domain-containing protein [Planctomycetota bacterium]
MNKRIATGCVLCLGIAASASAQNVSLYEGDGAFFTSVPGGFTFDSFATGVTESPTSLTVDVSAFGGLGRDLTAPVTVDETTASVRLEYRVLDNNEAADFRVILRDNDGDDSAPGLGTEDHQLFVDMSFASPLNDGSGFSEQFVPLNPVFRAQSFGFANDGDGVLNLGLDQWQIQSAFGSATRLNIEVRSVEIVPEPTTLGFAVAGLALVAGQRRRLA